MDFTYQTLPQSEAPPSYASLFPSLAIQSPPPPLSEQEDVPYSCFRCGNLFLHSQNLPDACRYHPGQFSDGQTISLWRCCKLPRNSPGCSLSYHAPNIEAHAQLSSYMNYLLTMENHRNIPDSSLPSTPPPKTSPPKRVIQSESTPQDGFIIHNVSHTDTLVGICLKYDISKSAVIKANKGLADYNLAAYPTLMIPINGADVIIVPSALTPEQQKGIERDQMAQRFKRENKVTIDEAKTYLSCNDWNYDLAVQDLKEGLKFEQNMAGKPYNFSATFNFK